MQHVIKSTLNRLFFVVRVVYYPNTKSTLQPIRQAQNDLHTHYIYNKDNDHTHQNNDNRKINAIFALPQLF